MKRIFPLAVLSVLIAGCGGEPEKKPGVTVTAGAYGDKWPLKVQEARLDCDPPTTAFMEVEGKRYALNGNAIRAGMPRPDELRARQEDMFLADFTEKAMQVCQDKMR